MSIRILIRTSTSLQHAPAALLPHPHGLADECKCKYKYTLKCKHTYAYTALLPHPHGVAHEFLYTHKYKYKYK